MTRPIPPPELPNWLSRRLPFMRSMVQVGDHHVHVMEQGTGRPVLLLHGNPTWGYLWRKVAAELSDEPLRLIMPDLVGLGFSSHPSASFHTLENHSAVVAGLVEAMDLRDVVLVVQDWGGPIGLHAFRRCPERLAGLVVLNTLLSEPREGFRPTAFHRFSQLPVVSTLVFRGLGFPQVGLQAAQGDVASIGAVDSLAYWYPLRNVARNAAPLALARMVPDSLEHATVPALREVREFVSSLNLPAAIVWGDRDPVLGRAFSWLEKLVRPFSVTRTSAGHFLQEEVPVDIAEAIREVVAACS